MTAERTNIMDRLTNATVAPSDTADWASLAALLPFLPVALGSADKSGKPASAADVADVVSWVIALVESQVLAVLTSCAVLLPGAPVRPALTAADVRVKPKAKGAVGVSFFVGQPQAKLPVTTTGGQFSAWINIHGDQLVATALRSALGAAGVSTTAKPAKDESGE
jgi:hypothetical protein